MIEELAKQRLGFERLRPGQLSAVQALTAGRDVLAVLPTGGGKSAIYELAGLLRAGPTVVISPLIALQDDQLLHLRAAGLHAIVLNSQQSAREHVAALLASCDADTFIFLSPEQLTKEQTLQAIEHARPGLFVVDEAHLISQWGHDFRPDYMLLGAQARAVGAPVCLGLTATAAPPVRQEIVQRLGLRDPAVVIGDFDRPNIGLSVTRVRTVDIGAAQWQAGGQVRWTGAMTVAAVLTASDAQTERENEIERTRLMMMRRYAEHPGCRRSFLLSYFGQDYPGPCGNCDNDLEHPEAERADVPFAVGSRVASEHWGEGTVQRYDGDQVTILFDEHGYREMYLPVVLERALLRSL